MANLTFSKNGVPMGRNKSTAENNSSRWTAQEDNYLKMSLEEGLPSVEVAAKLGRSIASLQTRKWTLKLEGRFARSPKGSTRNFKSTGRTRSKATGTVTAPKGIQLFKIETGVPLPARNGRNEEARNQMREIFNQIKVGQSFVVPKNMVYVAQYIVNKEFQAYKLRTSATSADKKFFRIYRVA
jgi:hypothetical protein